MVLTMHLFESLSKLHSQPSYIAHSTPCGMVIMVSTIIMPTKLIFESKVWFWLSFPTLLNRVSWPYGKIHPKKMVADALFLNLTCTWFCTCCWHHDYRSYLLLVLTIFTVFFCNILLLEHSMTPLDVSRGKRGDCCQPLMFIYCYIYYQ